MEGKYYMPILGEYFTIYDDSEVEKYCFRGTIINKAELKKLMQ
jgi:hypothetical protein